MSNPFDMYAENFYFSTTLDPVLLIGKPVKEQNRLIDQSLAKLKKECVKWCKEERRKQRAGKKLVNSR